MKKLEKEVTSSSEKLIGHIGMVMEMGLTDDEDPMEYCKNLLEVYTENQTKERCQRISADFDNYKKRMSKQMSDVNDAAKFKTVEEFLLILDDWTFFENVVDDSPNENIKTGFQLIDRKIKSFLEDVDIIEVPTNIPFDEDIHEAMTVLDENKEKGTILKVISKGYQIGDRIMKYPKVIVQK